MEQAVREQKVMYCEKEKCKDKKRPVKPNITFFGEQLPVEFTDLLNPGKTIMNECDLLIVMGTALAVSPFNALIRMASKNCLKVLMNMNNTKDTGGYDFCEKDSDKLFL